MRRRLALGCCTLLMGVALACSQSDQETERQRAAEAREKARRATEHAKEETRKLGHELKQEAKQLDQNIDRALQAKGTTQPNNEPNEKLRAAGAKLDRAAMIAKVKAKLAADVGLSTVTSVDVDATGQVVTLRGTVSSEDQKQQAENAVKQLSGVTRVINLLRVE